MTEQLDAVEERVDDAEEAPEGLTEEIEAFREALDEVDEELGDVSGGASVWGTIQSSSSPPTADQLWQTDRTWDDLPAVIERVNELLTTRMPALLARVYAEAVRPEVGQAVVMPSREKGSK